MRHHRVALWERRTPYGGNTPSLPSLVASSKSFCFDYCQLLHLGLEDNDIVIRCAENERHIAVAKGGGIRQREYDGVGLVHRRASFATQSLPNGGWNALLIVDEALKRILTGERSKYYIAQTKLPPAPYQGGYQDFLPFESLEDAQKTPGPGRVSIFDDLNHYLESHFSSLQLSEDAMSSTLFLQKIIASELTLVAQYFRSVLYQLGWLLTRRRTFKNFSTNWVEESWSDLNAYERRLDELRRGVDVILHFLQERIPPNPTHPRDWRDGVPDFTWLAAELDALTQRAAKLLDAFASLSSLVGTRESLREAGSASTLAFAGLIFVPLSLVASILSLPDPYSPHRSQFGMYWALALPITVAIVVGYCGVIWWKLLPPEWKSFSRKHTA